MGGPDGEVCRTGVSGRPRCGRLRGGTGPDSRPGKACFTLQATRVRGGCLGGHPGSASGQGSQWELESHLPGAWECLGVQGSSWVPGSTRVREERNGGWDTGRE